MGVDNIRSCLSHSLRGTSYLASAGDAGRDKENRRSLADGNTLGVRVDVEPLPKRDWKWYRGDDYEVSPGVKGKPYEELSPKEKKDRWQEFIAYKKRRSQNEDLKAELKAVAEGLNEQERLAKIEAKAAEIRAVDDKYRAAKAQLLADFKKETAGMDKKSDEYKKLKEKHEKDQKQLMSERDEEKEKAKKDADWRAKCMAWQPDLKGSFSTGDGLGKLDLTFALTFIEDLKQKAIQAIIDLVYASLPDGARQSQTAAKVGNWVRIVTDAAKCFNSTVKKINEMVDSYVEFINDAMYYAEAQMAAAKAIAANVANMVNDFTATKEFERLKQGVIDAGMRKLVTYARNSGWADAIGAIDDLRSEINGAIDLAYSSYNGTVGKLHQLDAHFGNLQDQFRDIMKKETWVALLKKRKSDAEGCRLKDDYLEGFYAAVNHLLVTPGSYDLSLTNCGAWREYSMTGGMADGEKMLKNIQGYASSYGETREPLDEDGVGAPPAIVNVEGALVDLGRLDLSSATDCQKKAHHAYLREALAYENRHSTYVSSGLVLDSCDAPGTIIVSDDGDGLVSCGLGRFVDHDVFLALELLIDNGTTTVVSMSRGGDDLIRPGLGSYITYKAQELYYTMIFPVRKVSGHDSHAPTCEYVRVDDGEICCGRSWYDMPPSSKMDVYGYGTDDPAEPLNGYSFTAWELIVDDASDVRVGDVYTYMNPNTLHWHGHRLWHLSRPDAIGFSKEEWREPRPYDKVSVRLVPYGYRVTSIMGSSVFVELDKDPSLWLAPNEAHIQVDDGTGAPILTSDGRYIPAVDVTPHPYYKPTHEFGMGGTACYGDDGQPADGSEPCAHPYPVQAVEWGLGNDMFVECLDACPPMAITPVCEHGGRTLYSAAREFSPGDGQYWNVAVRESSIKLTRVFGVMEPSEVPHAMDSIKCDNWTLTLRFIGPKEKVNALNFIKSADKAKIDYFFIKAKWGFVASETARASKKIPPPSSNFSLHLGNQV